MAQFTKKEFKNLLKECLREILKEEGILNFKENKTIKENFRISNDDLLTNPRMQKNNDSVVENSVFKESIDILSSVVGGEKKSLYAKILEDTAMGEYQKQLEPGVMGNVGIEKQYTDEEMKNDLAPLRAFSTQDDMKHWAKIAFSKK